nr:MAG TPA: hypothetical protein [Caudoviricetes sp.]
MIRAMLRDYILSLLNWLLSLDLRALENRYHTV